MKFSKMQGCGNNYIYVSLYEHLGTDDFPALARRVSDVHFGIGSDGLITIGPSEKADFRMRIFNADGSEAEMCGNGIRCVGKYVYDHHLTDMKDLSIETRGGIRRLRLFTEMGKVHSVRVDMGCPALRPEAIPVLAEGEQVIDRPITVGGREWRMTCLSMGNPHAVVFADNPETFPVETFGPLFENHKSFPQRVNTEFVKVNSRCDITMRVWERGSGETWACGTGACAAAAACILNGRTDRRVTVHLRGGDLLIEWDESSGHVFMTGPAVEIFTGDYELR